MSCASYFFLIIWGYRMVNLPLSLLMMAANFLPLRLLLKEMRKIEINSLIKMEIPQKILVKSHGFRA